MMADWFIRRRQQAGDTKRMLDFAARRDLSARCSKADRHVRARKNIEILDLRNPRYGSCTLLHQQDQQRPQGTLFHNPPWLSVRPPHFRKECCPVSGRRVAARHRAARGLHEPRGQFWVMTSWISCRARSRLRSTSSVITGGWIQSDYSLGSLYHRRFMNSTTVRLSASRDDHAAFFGADVPGEGIFGSQAGGVIFI